MSDLVLAVRLTADGSGLKGELRLSEDALKKLGDAGDQAGKGLDEAGQASEDAERRAAKLRDTAAALGTILGTAVGGGAVLAVKGLKDFAEAERIQLRFEQVLRATGNAAGVTASEIEDLADSIERSTFATGEEVLQAASVLATFRSVSGDVFRRALVLGQDLAAVFGQSLAGSATQLGKALEDPIEGITALNRVGVTFTETQKDMIQQMVRTGDIAGAQTVILDTLEQQVGGAGSAEAGGLAGAFNTAADSVGNLLENLGRLVDEQLGISQALLAIAGGAQILADAASGGRTELDQGKAEQLARVLQLNQQIAEAEAAGDQNRSQRLRSERDAVVEYYKFTQADFDAYNADLEAQAQAADGARLAAIERASEAAANLVAGLKVDLEGLATPTEKIDAVNRTLGETVERLNALRGQGAPSDTVDQAIALAQERARRQIQQIQVGSRAGGASDDEKAQAKLDAYLDKLRFEADQLGLTAEQQAIYNNLRAAGIDITGLLVDASGRLLGSYSQEAEEVAGLTRTILEKSAAEEDAARSKTRQQDLDDQLAMLRLEKELLGSNDNERELRLALLERELELKREGIALTSEQAQAELDATEQLVRKRQELEDLQDQQDEIQSAFERGFDRIGAAITQAFADGSIASLDFSQIAKAVLSELLQEMFRIAVLNPLKKAFSDVLSGLGGLFSPSAPSAGGVSATNIISPGSPIFQLHGGGMVGQGGNAARSIDMGVFANARRFHRGGLLPGEWPIIAQDGEEVLARDDPRNQRNGGGRAPKVEVHIHEATGTRSTVRQQRDGDNLRLDVMVELLDEAQAQRISRGNSKSAMAMERKYGISRNNGELG